MGESTGEKQNDRWNDRVSALYQYLKENNRWYQYWKMSCTSRGEPNDSCTDPWNDFDAEADYAFHTFPPMKTDQGPTLDEDQDHEEMRRGDQGQPYAHETERHDQKTESS